MHLISSFFCQIGQRPEFPLIFRYKHVSLFLIPSLLLQEQVFHIDSRAESGKGRCSFNPQVNTVSVMLSESYLSLSLSRSLCLSHFLSSFLSVFLPLSLSLSGLSMVSVCFWSHLCLSLCRCIFISSPHTCPHGPLYSSLNALFCIK